MATAEKLNAQEKQWRAEADAHALANADAIRGDTKRLKAAETAAKRIVKQEQEAAKQAKDRANGMAKLAGQGAAAFGRAIGAQGGAKKATKKKAGRKGK